MKTGIILICLAAISLSGCFRHLSTTQTAGAWKVVSIERSFTDSTNHKFDIPAIAEPGKLIFNYQHESNFCGSYELLLDSNLLTNSHLYQQLIQYSAWRGEEQLELGTFNGTDFSSAVTIYKMKCKRKLMQLEYRYTDDGKRWTETWNLIPGTW